MRFPSPARALAGFALLGLAAGVIRAADDAPIDRPALIARRASLNCGARSTIASTPLTCAGRAAARSRRRLPMTFD
jgi:hypothetical protein